jgi:hypothetical protein
MLYSRVLSGKELFVLGLKGTSVQPTRVAAISHVKFFTEQKSSEPKLRMVGNICRCCFLLARECFSVLRGALSVLWSLCVSLSRSVARTWARGCGADSGKASLSRARWLWGESDPRFRVGGRRCLDISVYPGILHLMNEWFEALSFEHAL